MLKLPFWNPQVGEPFEFGNNLVVLLKGFLFGLVGTLAKELVAGAHPWLSRLHLPWTDNLLHRRLHLVLTTHQNSFVAFFYTKVEWPLESVLFSTSEASWVGHPCIHLK